MMRNLIKVYLKGAYVEGRVEGRTSKNLDGIATIYAENRIQRLWKILESCPDSLTLKEALKDE